MAELFRPTKPHALPVGAEIVDMDAAAMMLVKLLKRVEDEKAGIVDRVAGHRSTAMVVHLDA